MNDGSKKAIYAAFSANLGIAISKFVGAAFTGSAGLLAEAVHSLADTGNQALLLLGAKRSRREPTPQFQFGFGAERYFWSFIVALVLFMLGGIFALYEGISKFRHPHETSSFGLGVTILIVAIVLETFSLRTAMKEANKLKPAKVSWFRYIKSTKQPELPVVLLEDFGAETGLILALGGLLLAHFTGDPRWDAIGSIAIGVLLVVIAFILASEMKHLLIGESADPDLQREFKHQIELDPRIKEVIHMETLHIGPDDVLVAAKIDVNPDISVTELAKTIDEAEIRVRSVTPFNVIIHIEPDIKR
ncbi:MAG: cation transporter [Actinobacteria bacterium]|nr:cation transporter [Actinomycetota bacterium]